MEEGRGCVEWGFRGWRRTFLTQTRFASTPNSAMIDCRSASRSPSTLRIRVSSLVLAFPARPRSPVRRMRRCEAARMGLRPDAV